MSAVSRLPIRIYYEDTDAGGIVYHASYLRFMERGRTEMLRELGFGQANMMEQGVQFVLSELNLKYRQPARLDDQVIVESRIVDVRRTWIGFEQAVVRDGTVLCQGTFKVACISTESQRPIAMPDEVRQQFDVRES
ncbi:tol-pal system-associated acyl-CoA thioesterase [Endozoicomonadaceae bacterium StTr2]